MGFSADWLALREGADHRSRSGDLLARVAQVLADKDITRVIDLGSGTGSNLRATAPSLGDTQEWTLVDYDPALLEEAARALTGWADEAKAIGDQLVLIKGIKTIGVTFRIADLNTELEQVLGSKADLVTASALFDLISEPWMRRFVRAMKSGGAHFYTVLTYNGEDAFTPNHPMDGAMVEAFKTHQKRDKGFGPAEGPNAAATLARILREEGYGVEIADTPWVLEPADSRLTSELLKGVHGAVSETGLVSSKDRDHWLATRLEQASTRNASMKTGHTDILAIRS